MAKKTFRTAAEASDHLLSVLVTHGIYEDHQIEKATQIIVAGISPTMRGEYNESNEWAAAEFIGTYLEANPDGLQVVLGNQNDDQNKQITPPGGGEVKIDDKQDKPKTKTEKWKPVDLVSEEATRRIEEQSSRLLNEGRARSLTATLDKFVVANNPKDIINALKGEKIKVKADEATFKKHEENLVPGEKNEAAFKSIKERALKGETFDIHISELPTRSIGIIVSYDQGNEGKSEIKPRIVPEAEVFELLISKLANRIPTGKNGLGVKYDSLRATKKSGHATAGVEQVKPKLVYVGRTQALKDPEAKYLEFANKVIPGEKVTKSVPITETFEVYVGTDTKADGTRKVRKVRLQGATDKYPVFQRSSDEMLAAFHEIARADVITPVSDYEIEQEAAKIGDMLRGAVQGFNLDIPASMRKFIHETQAVENKAFNEDAVSDNL